MILASMALSYGAFTALSLAMDRHQRDVLGRRLSPGRARLLRALGWAGLAASFAPCILAQGWAMGPVLWFGVLSVSAAALVLMIPYAPRTVPALGALLPMAALAWMALSPP